MGAVAWELCAAVLYTGAFIASITSGALQGFAVNAAFATGIRL